MITKNLSKPDDLRTLPKTKIEIVNFSHTSIIRATFDAGWKWSECEKPVVGTDSCILPHNLYVISGNLTVKMDDGKTYELAPGDAAEIPPGHDAWVVGDKPCEIIDFAASK
ncbi:MAG: cupin domain-containing protein [Ignavibacteria bacterium]|nr:cupin domain-containing protein [Ignavibacteria bacterium]